MTSKGKKIEDLEFIKYIKEKMKYPNMIKKARKLMRQTQTEFGERFGAKGVAVSLWESGKREAPYAVLEFCEDVTKEVGFNKEATNDTQ